MCLAHVKAVALESDSVCMNDTLERFFNADELAPYGKIETDTLKPRPWIALGEVAATDLLNHGICRFILDEPYAHTSLHSIHDNLRSKPKWDNDFFYLNHMGHPYQGNLYFNAARSNGLSFWQSVPYAFAGSILWEMACETEPPAINDLVTTTFSGACIGEVANRLSGCILKDSDRGAKRFVREAAAALINPLQGFNRLVSGRMWKVRRLSPEEAEGNNAKFTVTLGDRYLTHTGQLDDGRQNAFVAFSMEYGTAADGENHSRPYDYFTFDTELSLSPNQPLMSRMHITGRLLSRQQGSHGEIGLYQHFRYDEARLEDKQVESPFPIGEMVSVGPGAIWVWPHLFPKVSMDQHVFVNGVAMGAIESDYYSFGDRTYNLGSGFSASTRSRLDWQNVGSIELQTRYLHLFTWKGYEKKDLTDVDPLTLNAQGDHSNARLFSARLKAAIHMTKTLALSLDATYTTRHTHYKYFPNRQADGYEYRAALSWVF